MFRVWASLKRSRTSNNDCATKSSQNLCDVRCLGSGRMISRVWASGDLVVQSLAWSSEWGARGPREQCGEDANDGRDAEMLIITWTGAGRQNGNGINIHALGRQGFLLCPHLL